MPSSAKGPYLQAALLCEKVITDANGVLSFINVIDQVGQAATGAEPPEQMPPFRAQFQSVVLLKAGETRGRYAIKVRPEDPSGSQLTTIEAPVQFAGTGVHGVAIISEVNIDIGLEGLWWFDVIFVRAPSEEELLTRMPLMVIYQPQPTGPASPMAG